MNRPFTLSVGAFALAAFGYVGMQQTRRADEAPVRPQIDAVVARARAQTAAPDSASRTSSPCVAYSRVSDLPQGTSPSPSTGVASDVIEQFLASPATPIESTNSKLKYILAVVPDPRHTHLSITFDRSIEAIQAAAQDTGFTYHSSWMPWPFELSHYARRSDAVDEEKDEEERDACPGILLFRRTLSREIAASATEPFAAGMLVFLIGEQPTGGLNLKQWDTAVEWLSDHADENEAEKRILPVLGPSFSGSLPSLDQRLEALLSQESSSSFGVATVLSGSISGCSSLEWLKERLNFWRAGTKLRGPEIWFGTFHENDALQTQRFLDYLKGEGIRPSEVAILSEDETAYGGGSIQGNCQSANGPADQPLYVYYPRDISGLRTAYQEQSIFDTGSGPNSESYPSNRIVLRPNLAEEAEESGDTVRSYSKEQSEQGDEAELYGIVNFLRAHHSQYVVLRSTNPVDFLFLTKFLHHRYPQGRIVTLGADLLFSREVDTTEYRGTMSVTNYPLLPLLQHWARMQPVDGNPDSSHRHRVFSSDTMEGFYNAARALMACLPGESDMAKCLVGPSVGNSGKDALSIRLRDSLPDHASPFWLNGGAAVTDAHPPTWLTVVGRDGYWPVAVLETDAQKEAMTRIEEVDEKGKLLSFEHPEYDFPWVPRSWAACMFVAVLLIAWNHRRSTRRDQSLLLGPFTGDGIPGSSQQILLMVLTAAFAAAVAYELLYPFVLVAPDALTTHGVSLTNAYRLLRVLAVLFAVGAGAGLRVLLNKAAVAATPTTKANLLSAAGYLVASVVALLLCALFGIGSVGKGSGFPELYRSLHLNDGVSPILPIIFLLLGLYVWSLQGMAGNALLGEGRPLLPICHLQNARNCLYALGPARYRLSSFMAEKVESHARPFSLTPAWVPLVPSALACAFMIISFRSEFPIYAFEGEGYHHFLAVLMVFGVLIVITGATRLYWTWRGFQRLLTELARSPLRRTFFALRNITVKSLFQMSRHVPRSQYEFFARQMSYARRLKALLDDGSELGRAMQTLLEYGEVFMVEYQSRLDFTTQWHAAHGAPTRKVRELMRSCATGIINDVLEPAWLIEEGRLEQTSFPENASKSEEDFARPDLPLSREEDVRVGEAFVCLLYISYIQNILARMKTMIFSCSAVLISMMLAVGFYPFAPRTAITSWLLVLLLGLGAVVGLVYAGLERDKVLSLITNTPARLGWEFWGRFGAFLLPPLIALITAQFPEASDLVASWVQPGLGK